MRIFGEPVNHVSWLDEWGRGLVVPALCNEREGSQTEAFLSFLFKDIKAQYK